MIFEPVLSLISHILCLMGVMVICYAALKCMYLFYQGVRGRSVHFNRIRLELGYAVILALEFIVGADIIESIAKPTYYDIGILASLVLIRTFLSYFLNKELQTLPLEHQEIVQDISK